MKTFRDYSLKNKIFVSTLAVILLISVLIALFTRWILISSLTSELQRRGLGIAYSIAESSRGFILTEELAELTSLIFDARLGERRELVMYVFVLNKQNQVLAHTFIRDFPQSLILANLLSPNQSERIQLLRLHANDVYDVAVPVKEGIYKIATVHVGLNKNHIDQLIGKLRTTFLGFVSVVTIIFFGISHRLSQYITRPISALIKVSDEISQGNFDMRPNLANTSSGPGDEVHQLAESFSNMTQHIKTSQQKLRESEAKYRSLFNSGPNPIFVLDRQTLEILDANPSAEETYGYTRSEMVGLPFETLGSFDCKRAYLDEAYHTDTVNAKMRYYRKDGGHLYVNVHASPTRYKNREAVIVATTDITEIVEKDSQLIQASKMTTLGEMSAGIAHELNQPLNAIKMGSEYLKMMIEQSRRIPDQDLFTVVVEVSNQVDRAAEIINRLRDFGRKADFSKEKINIHQPIQGVMDIVGKQLRLQNIAVELETDECIPPVLAHHNRLEQVIFNLVTNARDAINQRQESDNQNGLRTIRIRSFMDGEHVAVSVADTGIGIPEAIREQIFEAFFTTKKMGEGMGLGLTISSGIVEDYGGQINVNSTEGIGTTVTLRFPKAI